MKIDVKELVPSYFSKGEELKKIGGAKVLNVGCGDGNYDKILKRNFEEVFGIDINLADLKNAKSKNKGAAYGCSFAEYLPFKNESFDTVVCLDVLEHVDSDTKTLSEIYRVLRPEGILFLIVPNRNFPITFDPINFVLQRTVKKHLPIGVWGFGHVRLHTEQDITNKLVSAGFQICSFRKQLGFLVGLFENHYLLNILQPLTKTSAKNKFPDREEQRVSKVGKSRAIRSVIWLRNSIISLDKKISGGGFQMVLKARKAAT